jgi:hypothetical protein
MRYPARSQPRLLMISCKGGKNAQNQMYSFNSTFYFNLGRVIRCSGSRAHRKPPLWRVHTPRERQPLLWGTLSHVLYFCRTVGAFGGGLCRATTFLNARSNDSGSLSVPISRAVSRMRFARSASVKVVFLAGTITPHQRRVSAPTFISLVDATHSATDGICIKFLAPLGPSNLPCSMSINLLSCASWYRYNE